MCAKTVSTVQQTHEIPTQTYPIPTDELVAPSDTATRFIVKTLYEADDENYRYTVDEFVKHYLLFGPVSNRSHMTSVRELRRAIAWLSSQHILYITEDRHIETHPNRHDISQEKLPSVTTEAIRHFRQSFGHKGRRWFYGHA